MDKSLKSFRAMRVKNRSITKIVKYLEDFTQINEEDYLTICMKHSIDPDDEDLILELINDGWMYIYADRCYIKDTI